MDRKRGAIFDWDGVIINSASQHEISWERLAKESGKVLPENHFKRGFGMKNEVIIPELLGWTTVPTEIRILSLRKEAIYREVVREQGIAALPGVEPWLRMLRRSESRASLPRPRTGKISRRRWMCWGLADFFADIVTAEDVKRGKPDPEVFLTAAQRIGVEPADAVVFEDALVGIEAAQAAGCAWWPSRRPSRRQADACGLGCGSPGRIKRGATVGSCGEQLKLLRRAVKDHAAGH